MIALLVLLASLLFTSGLSFQFALPAPLVGAARQYTEDSFRCPIEQTNCFYPLCRSYCAPSYSTANHLTKRRGICGKSITTMNLAMVPAQEILMASSAISIALPSIPSIGLACLLPTLSGYYRKEYTVSYSYGAAIAASAGLVLKSLLDANVSLTSIAAVHVLALLFYGVRLDLFLLYRELFVERFRTKKEELDSIVDRLSQRTPFIVGCALLYGFMAAPLLATSNLSNMIGTSIPFCSFEGGLLINLLRVLVGICWFGFTLAAIGDAQKSWIKSELGDDTLVTTGVYKFFRHPNYTGEIIAWTASALAALISTIPTDTGLLGNWPALVSSALGAAGIYIVLIQATATLEQRQEEKYGTRPEYQPWVDSSWVGFTKSKKND